MLNTSKTKYILFGSRHKLSQITCFNLGILGEPIERVYHFKYLGVILDQYLSFNEHIEYLLSKANQKLGVLRKVRKCLNRSLSLTLYKSLVLPHFDYCDVVYSCTSQENLRKLQLIQSSACRTLLLAESDRHIVDLHKKLHLDMLSTRRELHLTNLCHQNIYFDGLVGLPDFFVLVSPVVGRRTRSCATYCMKVPKTRTVLGQRAFRVRGPTQWNSILKELHVVKNLNSFKRQIAEKLRQPFENHPT